MKKTAAAQCIAALMLATFTLTGAAATAPAQTPKAESVWGPGISVLSGLCDENLKRQCAFPGSACATACGTGICTNIVTGIGGCACVPTLPCLGSVQVCKVAGAGITVGTNFSFDIAGTTTPVTVPAGPGPGGTCSPPVTVTAGTAVITEAIPAGTALTGVSTLPSAGLLVSSNLATGTATVTVNAGGTTIVTFVDAILTPPSVSPAIFELLLD